MADMDISKLNDDLTKIVELRNMVEESDLEKNLMAKTELELRKCEKQFLEQYGIYLEEVLKDVHDEICPDDQVLSPIDYLAKKYIDTGNKSGGKKVYEVENYEGVAVGVDDYPGKNTKLVILPNPMRIMLLVDDVNREELWRASMN
jgi:hypothetical protein